MSTITKTSYRCDRCGSMVEQGQWPDGWHSYDLPRWNERDPLTTRGYLSEQSHDLCTKCVKSLTKWMEDVNER